MNSFQCCGEQRTLLAKTVSDDLRAASGSCQPVDVFNQTIKSSFIDNPVLVKDNVKLAGAIVLYVNPESSSVELMWSHTTRSMCVSYMTAECAHPQSLVTRLAPGKVSQVPFTSGIGLRSETQAPA
ncbi:hypothetical protein EB796_001615 [Bugula neritina]|uniref:Uncharacterized protein n=1 Tax=Bugula neritina TaxID=10212 RepID=A0A7J7KPK4_BUGNE|nr:hypothetical protein EB796_001615 [Bugula neritina]